MVTRSLILLISLFRFWRKKFSHTTWDRNFLRCIDDIITIIVLLTFFFIILQSILMVSVLRDSPHLMLGIIPLPIKLLTFMIKLTDFNFCNRKVVTSEAIRFLRIKADLHHVFFSFFPLINIEV